MKQKNKILNIKPNFKLILILLYTLLMLSCILSACQRTDAIITDKDTTDQQTKVTAPNESDAVTKSPVTEEITVPPVTEQDTTAPVETTPPVTDAPTFPPTEDKKIYLTFDDGPHPTRTEAILNILDKYNVKATFFVTGYNAVYYPRVIHRIYNDGHALGNHSMTHKLNQIYKSPADFANDFEKWEASISSILGTLPPYKLFRFPGGSTSAGSNGKAIADYIKGKGYYIYDWTAANGDAYNGDRLPGEDYDTYLRRMIIQTVHHTRHGTTFPCIILAHDIKGETVNMIEWAIVELLELGYNFDTLDNLSLSYTFAKNW